MIEPSGFELVAICTREPRTEHALYVLSSGTLDIPKYVNFKQRYVKDAYLRFQKLGPHEKYWLVRHHKHGNTWRLVQSFEDYETAILWARAEARSYKRHGFEIDLAKDLDLSEHTVTIETPESMVAVEIVAADAALSGGNHGRVMEALTAITELETRLLAVTEIATKKKEQLENRFKGWFE